MTFLKKKPKGKGDKPELTKKPSREKIAPLKAVKTEKEKKPLTERTVKPAVYAKPKSARTSPKHVISNKILIKPHVTEKSAYLSSLNQYIFDVAPTANRIMIKKAIYDIYGVSPLKVNIINVLGKHVRFGRTAGKTKDWKKAVVTLREGEKINVYEGV